MLKRDDPPYRKPEMDSFKVALICNKIKPDRRLADTGINLFYSLLSHVPFDVVFVALAMYKTEFSTIEFAQKSPFAPRRQYGH